MTQIWKSNRMLKILGIKMIDLGILCLCIKFVNSCFTIIFRSHEAFLCYFSSFIGRES